MHQSKQDPITIAIADDHPLFRRGMADFLSTYPDFELLYDVGDGKQLLDKISEATSPKPAVCILDIEMPIMNGYQTATALKKQFPDIKIIALSLYNSELNVVKMIRSGACGYIHKAVDPELIRTAVLSVNHTGYFYSEDHTGTLMRSLKSLEKGAFNPSDKELEFLGYCCSELTYKEIADRMKLSVKTVDVYRDHLFHKLGVVSRIGLVMYAIKSGIVTVH